MNSITLLAITSLVFCCAAATIDYDHLTNRSIEGAELLLTARQRFAEIRSMDNSSERWNDALEDNYGHQELTYICHHIAYLDMLFVASSSDELAQEAHSHYNSVVRAYEANTHRHFCTIWVSEIDLVH